MELMGTSAGIRKLSTHNTLRAICLWSEFSLRCTSTPHTSVHSAATAAAIARHKRTHTDVRELASEVAMCDGTCFLFMPHQLQLFLHVHTHPNPHHKRKSKRDHNQPETGRNCECPPECIFPADYIVVLPQHPRLGRDATAVEVREECLS